MCLRDRRGCLRRFILGLLQLLPITCRFHRILNRDPPIRHARQRIGNDLALSLIHIYIWGVVSDISLTDWTLTAKGSSGKEVTVHADSTERLSEQLGVLDTGEFADGETIEILSLIHI